MLAEAKRRPFAGDVLILGAPDIYFDTAHFERMARLARVELDGGIPWAPAPKPDFAAKGYLDGRVVFRKLGFSRISVLDISAFEGADVIFDLNQPSPPQVLREAFDVVVDHGTLEHVFHFPNAMNNVFQMLRPGGRAITGAPSNGFLDHGFYMFQPTLFVDFYGANGWRVDSIQVVQGSPHQEVEPPFAADYEPGLFDSVGYGKMGDKLFTTICVATKLSGSTGDKCPMQGSYSRRPDWR